MQKDTVKIHRSLAEGVYYADHDGRSGIGPSARDAVRDLNRQLPVPICTYRWDRLMEARDKLRVAQDVLRGLAVPQVHKMLEAIEIVLVKEISSYGA